MHNSINQQYTPQGPVLVIKGAGEMASGIAWRLHRCGYPKIVMLETPKPLAVRRTVSFCEAVYENRVTVEGITAVQVEGAREITSAWSQGAIAVQVDPFWSMVDRIKPDILVDAILAKKNLGTSLSEAPLVVGCGPGFTAGRDVHLVVETQRGHDLGRVLDSGSAIPNTGIPGNIGGYTVERVLRAVRDGVFHAAADISDSINAGQVVGHIDGIEVTSTISGILRGLIRSGTEVHRGLKIGDVDPRAEKAHCYTVSDKARAIGGGVVEAILHSTADQVPKTNKISAME